jgi:hypothetical protein
MAGFGAVSCTARARSDRLFALVPPPCAVQGADEFPRDEREHEPVRPVGDEVGEPREDLGRGQRLVRLHQRPAEVEPELRALLLGQLRLGLLAEQGFEHGDPVRAPTAAQQGLAEQRAGVGRGNRPALPVELRRGRGQVRDRGAEVLGVQAVARELHQHAGVVESAGPATRRAARARGAARARPRPAGPSG